MKTIAFPTKKILVQALVSAGLFAAGSTALAQTNTFPADGKVGIGTTTPYAQLQVFSGTHTIPLWLQSSGTDNYLFLYNSNQDNTGGNSRIYMVNKSGNVMQTLHNTGDYEIAVGSKNTFYLSKNGQVGIGTNSLSTFDPKVKIVANGLGGNFPLFAESNSTTTFIHLKNTTTHPDAANAGFSCENPRGTFKQYLNIDGNYQFRTPANNVPLFLSNSGNVGIGTMTPDPAFKLSVNGSIRAKEVVVESDWADFVFEKDYKLKSLEQVEEYIKENKHLEEIPSAKEVEENGVKVGEIESKLLQKIEELTLYAIEANKQIKELEARLDSMENTAEKKEKKSGLGSLLSKIFNRN